MGIIPRSWRSFGTPTTTDDGIPPEVRQRIDADLTELERRVVEVRTLMDTNDARAAARYTTRAQG